MEPLRSLTVVTPAVAAGNAWFSYSAESNRSDVIQGPAARILQGQRWGGGDLANKYVAAMDSRDEELKQHICQITVWQRDEQQAPHKPFLLLYALGRCLNDGERLLPYAEVDRELRPLLIEYGPERKSCHTEYPFQRLTNDGLWQLESPEKLEQRASNSDVKKSEPLKHNVAGGCAPRGCVVGFG